MICYSADEKAAVAWHESAKRTSPQALSVKHTEALILRIEAQERAILQLQERFSSVRTQIQRLLDG